jgi:voltage-gated potassium channel
VPTSPDKKLAEASRASSRHASAARRLRGRVFEILDVAAEGDRVSRLADQVLIVLITLNVLAVVFESVESIHDHHESLFYWFEFASVIIFTAEYLLRIWCSVELPARNGQPPKRSAYLLSPGALIDLAAVLPFYLVEFGLMAGADARFLRAIRLVRVLKLTRYSAALDSLALAVKENINTLAAAFYVMIIVMLLAATGMFFFEHEAQPEVFSSIPASMWWAFATLTTVGYGDITPITVGGKVFGAIITMVGVGMVAIPAGILASAFSRQVQVRSERYQAQADLAWQDGVLSDNERQELESLRTALGMGEEEAAQIMEAEEARAAMRSRGCGPAAHCPTCGQPIILKDQDIPA